MNRLSLVNSRLSVWHKRGFKAVSKALQTKRRLSAAFFGIENTVARIIAARISKGILSMTMDEPSVLKKIWNGAGINWFVPLSAARHRLCFNIQGGVGEET